MVYLKLEMATKKKKKTKPPALNRSGLKMVTLWVPPEDHAHVQAMAKKKMMKQSGIWIIALRAYLETAGEGSRE